MASKYVSLNEKLQTVLQKRNQEVRDVAVLITFYTLDFVDPL